MTVSIAKKVNLFYYRTDATYILNKDQKYEIIAFTAIKSIQL